MLAKTFVLRQNLEMIGRLFFSVKILASFSGIGENNRISVQNFSPVVFDGGESDKKNHQNRYRFRKVMAIFICRLRENMSTPKTKKRR